MLSGARRDAGELLTRLRTLMKDKKHVREPLHALIVPTADAHHSEYISSCDARREFISGFTGSAGTAVITRRAAALWTDGRYHLQASQQLDSKHWQLQKQGLPDVPTQAEWLVQQLTQEMDGVEQEGSPVVGLDPWLSSVTEMEALHKELAPHGLRLHKLPHNLVDMVWGDQRPSRPNNPLRLLTEKQTGRHWADKLADMRSTALKAGAAVSVYSALDEVAWLLNLRGSDISHNPVFFAYLIVGTENTSYLCMDEGKLTPAVRQHLTHTSEKVEVHPYESASRLLGQIAGSHLRVCHDAVVCEALLSSVPEERRVLRTPSSAARLKAIKSSAEVEGMRQCHLHDAVAVCEYLRWLEECVARGVAVTEMTGAKKLGTLRSQLPDYVSLSFPTISASGPNGAVIHYIANESTDRPVNDQEMYLCDSGGQYTSGTTDITRTIHLGTPTAPEREAFTRVLKSHVNLARCVFPNDTRGGRLDVLARVSLWRAGLDYAHGTGHGVGAFLNVHEGPCSILGSRVRHDEVGLRANMVVTIEPGLYLAGRFGVRIENVVLVVEREACESSTLVDTPADGEVQNGKKSDSSIQLLGFESLTLVPIQKNLINPIMLTPEEISWLNEYHAEVREKVGAELLKQNKKSLHQWLLQQTEPLG